MLDLTSQIVGENIPLSLKFCLLQLCPEDINMCRKVGSCLLEDIQSDTLYYRTMVKGKEFLLSFRKDELHNKKHTRQVLEVLWMMGRIEAIILYLLNSVLFFFPFCLSMNNVS